MTDSNNITIIITNYSNLHVYCDYIRLYIISLTTRLKQLCTKNTLLCTKLNPGVISNFIVLLQWLGLVLRSIVHKQCHPI